MNKGWTLADQDLLTGGSRPRYPPVMARDDDEVFRIRSTRGYRRMADRALREAILGKRSAQDAAAIVASCKAATEMFMAEKTLERAGIDTDSGADHKHGMDGTFEPRGSAPFRRKKVVAKTGVDKQGCRIDEKSVAIETTAEDEAAEREAEDETLA